MCVSVCVCVCACMYDTCMFGMFYTKETYMTYVMYIDKINNIEEMMISMIVDHIERGYCSGAVTIRNNAIIVVIAIMY